MLSRRHPPALVVGETVHGRSGIPAIHAAISWSEDVVATWRRRRGDDDIDRRAAAFPEDFKQKLGSNKIPK
jgi:hypothetical protein